MKIDGNYASLWVNGSRVEAKSFSAEVLVPQEILGDAASAVGSLGGGRQTMTQETWRQCPDARRMLEWLGVMDEPGSRVSGVTRYWDGDRASPPVSARKLRLFSCAVCRHAWHLLTDQRSRRAVEVAERFADGDATEGELLAARDRAYQAVPNGPDFTVEDVVGLGVAIDPFMACREHVFWTTEHVPAADQAALLREIVGDPFRPATFRPEWRTRDTLAVARAAYAARDWGDLPYLADALEEAGCADGELLGHLKGPGPHALGCWAMDLVLGKE